MDKLKKVIKHYGKHQLDEANVNHNPFLQFGEWLDDALREEPREPNAMALATVDSEGKPSVRIMLLKDFDERGFAFFSNYQSRKGLELASNPNAALVFWWPNCERQVRVEGRVEPLTAEESDNYFHSRSVGSRLGAHTSPQSQKIPDRAFLEKRYAKLQQQYANNENIPRPKHWGGYRLIPTAIEFWQGGPHRLHDRLRFEKQKDGGWRFSRIAP